MKSENTNDILYKVYPLPKYTIFKKDYEKICEEYELEELIDLLKHDYGYHMRIKKNKNYTLFGDIDNFHHEFTIFRDDFIKFMKKSYDVTIDKDHIKHTSNKSKKGSYHYSIPNYYCSCEKLKEIHENFIKEHQKDEYFYTIEDNHKHCIDTSIYSDHWFRLPMQSKESDKNTIHRIIHGEMEDFIVQYIPNDSVNIEDKEYKFNKKVEKKKKINEIIIQPTVQVINDNIDIILQKSNNYKFYTIYRQIFDKCYTNQRFNTYEYWLSIGMALKNIYGMDAFELFDYFSSKGSNYEGTEKTLSKYHTFKEGDTTCKGIGTIYHYAKEDNIDEYKKIIYVHDKTFMETDFAEKIYELAGDRFIYKKVDDGVYHLYCYNGKYWEQDDLLLRKYISSELYEYYKDLLTTVYWNHNNQNFNKLKTQIENLKRLAFKQSIVATYKEYGVKNIDFDNKWWLFGFNNIVLDLKTHTFRNYEKEDYISITVGYDWEKPTEKQLNTMKEIIKKIMPIKDERRLYKEILSTSLEGRCLEKFIVFNGGGRNGKGLIDDLLIIALGYYGIAANSSLLFEKSKTGSNPEKANLHKKRLVIFKEPPAKSKYENSSIKELTGGGKFSARSHNEKKTEKVLHNTTICECNKRPLFAEEPTDAEIGRTIDLLFRSKFTDKKEEIDETNGVYPAVLEYKEVHFQEEHKYALLQILINSHKKYAKNNYIFNIPETIRQRTAEYLESNCQLLEWFRDEYDITKDKNEVLLIKDIYENFKFSEYYENLTKYEKRKFNYKYFVEYFSTNIVTKKNYKETHERKILNERERFRNILLFWKKKEDVPEPIKKDVEYDLIDDDTYTINDEIEDKKNISEEPAKVSKKSFIPLKSSKIASMSNLLDD